PSAAVCALSSPSTPAIHTLSLHDALPIYEDEFFAVVNKPADMVVHPAKGHWSGTLVNALRFHFDQLSGANGDYRAGIVHRLDREDRKSTRLNSSHVAISYAVFCLKKKTKR